jgi:hypothetical protein
MSLMSELPAGDTHDVIHRGNEVVAVRYVPHEEARRHLGTAVSRSF